jgi:hypothetical protein
MLQMQNEMKLQPSSTRKQKVGLLLEIMSKKNEISEPMQPIEVQKIQEIKFNLNN